MQTSSEVRAHFRRVVNMARACDVDLSTALDEGRIDVPACSDMVMACRGCAQVGACDGVLAKSPKLAQVPEYCENGDAFARLRRVL